jgi:hypothetical protein
MLVDITRWREAARAHGERFYQVRPACTFLEVSRFIDRRWLADAGCRRHGARSAERSCAPAWCGSVRRFPRRR